MHPENNMVVGRLNNRIATYSKGKNFKLCGFAATRPCVWAVGVMVTYRLPNPLMWVRFLHGLPKIYLGEREMATHPLETMPNCTCDWGGDDHYPRYLKWNPTCPHHKDPNRPRASITVERECYVCKGTGIVESHFSEFEDNI